MGMRGNGNGNGFMGMGGNGNRNSPSRTPLIPRPSVSFPSELQHSLRKICGLNSSSAMAKQV